MHNIVFLCSFGYKMASALTRRLATEPVSKVEVHVSCDKLLDRDITSKSDPCCLLYVLSSGHWVEVSSLFSCYISTRVLSLIESLIT